MAVAKITNANAYLNGQSLIGKLDSISLPSVEQQFEEYSAIGLVGDMQISTGLKSMEAKLKWKAFYVEDFLQIAAYNKVQSVIIRGNQEEYNQMGRLEQKGVIVAMTGMFMNLPLGNIEAKSWKDMETTMKITSLSMMIDNIPVFEIDVLSNTYSINGVNLYRGMNQNT